MKPLTAAASWGLLNTEGIVQRGNSFTSSISYTDVAVNNGATDMDVSLVREPEFLGW